MKNAILVVLPLWIAGCNYNPAPDVTEVGDTHYISTTADQRSIVSVPAGIPMRRICAEPSPDAAVSVSDGGSLGVQLVSLGGNVDRSGGAEDATQETELTGRTPALLISRELLYRACELNINHPLSTQQALQLHHQTLAIIAKVWQTEAANTTVTIGETEASSISEGEGGIAANLMAAGASAATSTLTAISGRNSGGVSRSASDAASKDDGDNGASDDDASDDDDDDDESYDGDDDESESDDENE